MELAPRIAYGLFKGEPLRNVQDAARRHACLALDPASPPRVVEVSMPADFGYPFEMLPWHVAERADPALRARALMGMSAIVRRRIRRVEQASGIDRIEIHQRLPLNLLCHVGLSTEASEAAFFAEIPNLVDVYGPFPEAGALPEHSLALHLLDSCTPLSDAAPDRPAAILHLACHTNTTPPISDDHDINVGGKNGTVRLGELKTQASQPEAWDAPRPRPLIFLNSCGSAVPNVASRVSFPEFFIDQESLGVIGTLCDISDVVAGHFAAVFYEALLRGRTIGESMHDARWHLMERHGNPLGLLYTFHGNPDIKVARPQAGSVVPACRSH
jgi:hypothetical protein